VDAARKVFDSAPYAETRVTDICAAAGVATGTFYTYFNSKLQIFEEVAAVVLADLSEAPRRRRDNADGDRVAGIEHATRQYFLACRRNAGIALSIEQVRHTDDRIASERRAAVLAGVKRAERWIVRLQRDGICDPSLNAWYTALALHIMTVRVAYDHLLTAGDDVDVDVLVHTVTLVWARTLGLQQVELS
jgi:AcrR family transcriptional regulator